MVTIIRSFVDMDVCLSGTTVMTIHFLSSSVIHRLLLFDQLTEPFSDGHTVRYRTLFGFALTRVNLKKSPDSLTHMAPSSSFDLTMCSVFE